MRRVDCVAELPADITRLAPGTTARAFDDDSLMSVGVAAAVTGQEHNGASHEDPGAAARCRFLAFLAVFYDFVCCQCVGICGVAARCRAARARQGFIDHVVNKKAEIVRVYLVRRLLRGGAIVGRQFPHRRIVRPGWLVINTVSLLMLAAAARRQHAARRHRSLPALAQQRQRHRRRQTGARAAPLRAR